MDEALFERILLPLADPDDAERTARAVRPYLDEENTLVMTHILQGEAAGTTISTGKDQFAPRDLDVWSRTLAGDPGGRLVRDTDVPVMVFPSRTEALG